MKLIDDLRQRHLERFETAYNELRPPDGEGVGVNRLRGATVRAAVIAGWFGEQAKAEDVDDMKSADVHRLSKAIDELYIKAVRIDPN